MPRHRRWRALLAVLVLGGENGLVDALPLARYEHTGQRPAGSQDQLAALCSTSLRAH